MIHYQTKNLSFLKMSYILEKLEIENRFFFLQLNDPSLVDIDPYDLKIDQITMAKIIKEIKLNPWYFFREIIRIPISGEKAYFELHRGNLAIIWAMLNNISICVLFPRQCYKSWSIISVYLWFFYFGTMDSNTLFMSYDDGHVKKNIGIFKTLRDTLPKYLQFYNRKTDKDNVEEITFQTLNNKLNKKAPPSSIDAARKAGRGFSTPFIWFDESAHIKNINHIYNSALFAFKTIADFAKKRNQPYGKVFSTTAGWLTEEHGLWCKNLFDSSASFIEDLYDFDEKDVEIYIENNSSNGQLDIEYMYYDLGKDDNYLEEIVKETDDDDTIEREVLNKWMAVTKDHPLGQTLLKTLVSEKISPIDKLIINKIYLLKLYRKIEDIDFNKKYLIGLDASGNLSRDFTAVSILEIETGEVIGTLRCNQLSIALFSKALANILISLFSNSILVPERNATGIAIIDQIIMYDYSLKSRIYHDTKGKPGIYTDKNIRRLVYGDILRVFVDEFREKIHDITIISEVETLERKRNGRIDHMNNCHDDMLFATLLLFWFLFHAPFKDRYVDLSSILIDRDKNKPKGEIMEEKSKANTVKDLLTKSTINLHKNIDDLFTDIANTNQIPEQEWTINRQYKDLDIDEEKIISTEKIKNDVGDDYIPKIEELKYFLK